MDGTDAFYASLKSASPFFLMAGPNVIQSEEHIFRMCRSIKRITDEVGIPLVFKSSFDKANRTSAKSFRGPGMDEGLKILRAAKTTFDVPIVTDVHDACQAEPVGSVADVIQIPAFLCRQTDLLTAAAKTGRVVNVKKGQFCAASVMRNSVDKIRNAGNERVMVCERGTMFGYGDLVVDPRNLVWMRDADCPIVADVTHALQQPAGLASTQKAASRPAGYASSSRQSRARASPSASTACSWRCTTTRTRARWTDPRSGPCATSKSCSGSSKQSRRSRRAKTNSTST